MTTKLSPEEAVLHPRRATIVRIVRSEPGVHLKELARRLGCRSSPVLHHTGKLVRSGLISSRKEGQYLRFFPAEES